jgi:hypothetical protein
MSADPWADDVSLSDIEPRFVCKACGKRGADIGPHLAAARMRTFGLAFGSHKRAALAHNLQLGIDVQMLRDMLLRRAMPRIAPKAAYRQTNGNNAATDYE